MQVAPRVAGLTMDNAHREGSIGPSLEHRADDAVMRLVTMMFRDIVSDLLMSFPGDEYEDIPWQFRETGTDALMRNA